MTAIVLPFQPTPAMLRTLGDTLRPAIVRPRPAAAARQRIPADPDFLDHRRLAGDVGATGVHPLAVKSLIGGYAALMAVFWAAFGGPATDLTLGVITVLAVMYFGLLGGGVLVSDAASKSQPQRSFAAFWRGPVQIAGGVVSGREAYLQIMTLPVCLVAGASVFGLTWRLIAG
jgi:hypothetical protein